MIKTWHSVPALLTYFSLLLFTFFSCNKTGSEISASERPEENRFITTIMTQPGELDEPMAFSFLDHNRILVVERKGGVKLFNADSRVMQAIATIPVNTKYIDAEGQSREAEEGLMGVVADPNFAANHWVYLFYADPDTPKHVLGRWELRNDSLVEATKRVVLSFPTQREKCCHTGGGMVFDGDGNLYLTTGNNTVNPPAGTSNLDERPGRKLHDDQRTAGNTNDLRGKILRIHPEVDGSYTIPEGNLFAPDSEGARAEIYTMGHRNPWRVSIDSKTGYIYWGEVGPDASRDSSIGPQGYDEFNQARKAGFFGWPYFVGDNKPYTDFDFATGTLGAPFDTANVINDSPNNTGMQKLPTPQKAFIWYPYANSEEFPEVGSSGRSATGGPVFRASDFPASEHRFPEYYDGKWLIVEFMRGWIISVSMDANGDFAGMERFLPDEDFQSAIDLKFGPKGDLYVLEYGSAWFKGNVNAQIKRIAYNGGNRQPVVKASAERTSGALPFSTTLSAEGTMDYDQDKLTYEWTIQSDNGYLNTFIDPTGEITLEKAGVYQATLLVTDAQGESNAQAFEILVGNEPPHVDIDITKGNKSFFFPDQEIEYKISVIDQEDGSLAAGSIARNRVAINFDYAPEGFDPIEIAQNHRSTDEWTSFSRGAVLINENDCRSCHIIDQKSVGPSYLDISDRYNNNASEQIRLAGKIINGGTGVWGDHAMSAHPQLSIDDAKIMVKYILGLNDQNTVTTNHPIEGSLRLEVPRGDNGRGSYLLRAAYRDQGSGGIRSLSSEKIVALRNPAVNPEQSEMQKGAQLLTTPRRAFNVTGDLAHLGFKNLDLSGIGSIAFFVKVQPRVNAAGGVIEVHLDHPDGRLIGRSENIVHKAVDRKAIIEQVKAEQAKSGNADAPLDLVRVERLVSSLAEVSLEATAGKHDVYFVFRSPGATEAQILMQMVGIEFKREPRVEN